MSDTILVVDDQANVRTLLTDYMKGQGYRVVSAGDGQTALAQVFGDGEIPFLIAQILISSLQMKTYRIVYHGRNTSQSRGECRT